MTQDRKNTGTGYKVNNGSHDGKLPKSIIAIYATGCNVQVFQLIVKNLIKRHPAIIGGRKINNMLTVPMFGENNVAVNIRNIISNCSRLMGFGVSIP